MNLIFCRIAGLASATLLGLAVWWSLQLAVADQLSRGRSAESLAAACRLAPGNSEYRLSWGALIEETGRPAPEVYRHAVALRPFDASVWIRLGLRAEADGDFRAAEGFLLHAAGLPGSTNPAGLSPATTSAVAISGISGHGRTVRLHGRTGIDGRSLTFVGVSPTMPA